MKNIKLINSKFPRVDFDNLKNSDKKTVAIVNKLTNGLAKGSKVKLPLSSSVDLDTNKTVSVDVPSLIRTQYAVFNLLSVVYTYEEQKDLEGKAFRVYFAIVNPEGFDLPDEVLTEPKKAESKRPSSKETKAKAEQKKAEEQKAEEQKIAEEEALDHAFDMNTVHLIVDLSVSYGLKLPKERQSDFEKAIYKILTRV